MPTNLWCNIKSVTQLYQVHRILCNLPGLSCSHIFFHFKQLSWRSLDKQQADCVRVIWVEPMETQRSWLRDRFPDNIPDDLDVSWVTMWNSLAASLSHDRSNISCDVCNIHCCTPTFKRLWLSVNHEIKILVTDSCLHSSSTGLKALSSFISSIRLSCSSIRDWTCQFHNFTTDLQFYTVEV